MIQVLPVKKPNESWYVPFDFTNPLESAANPSATEDIGEIQDVSVHDLDANQDVTDVLTDIHICQIEGKVAFVWVTAGEHNHRYRVTCRIQTAESNQVFELSCYLFVREV